MSYTGYSSDPVLDAQRHMRQQELNTSAIDAEMQSREQSFIAACRNLDANAIADWAPKVRDVSFTNGPVDAQKIERSRYQTLAEVMRESLDYGGANDVSDTELMQFVIGCAYGADLANVPRVARILIMRMAATHATNNAGI